MHNYAGRALGSTKPGDIIQLPGNLKEHWGWINSHYRRAGVSFTKEVIWNDDFSAMVDYPDYVPSVFFFGKKAHSVRPDQRWFNVVEQLNSKNYFIDLCKKLGIKTPPTWNFNSKNEVCDCAEFPYPCYLKIAVSVSGLGVVRCNTQQELESELSLVDQQVPFQIQKSIEAFSFLNLQYRKNGKLERLAATEQVLKGCCHAGNAFPTLHQPWHMTDSLARLMVDNGMQGYFAFDIAACDEPHGIGYYAIECNPRYNGSSYPTNIAKKLDIPVWTAKKVSTSCNSFEGIDLGELEYSTQKKEGVIVVNWGCITERELSVLFVAPTLEKQLALEEKLEKIV